MGHYGDLYDAEQDAMKREKLLEQDENLSTQFDDLMEQMGKFRASLRKSSHRNLAWERLVLISSQLRKASAAKHLGDAEKRSIEKAIEHIDTAVLWLNP